MNETALTAVQRQAARVALLAWTGLLLLCVLWELWLAPVRPGGSWLWLKGLPLLLPLRGLIACDNRAFQWALLLVFAYAAEGAVRAFEPAPYSTLAWTELLLAAVFFGAAIAFVRPFKQAARARAAALKAAR